MRSLLLGIVLILLIAAVGFVVYYFGKSKESVFVQTTPSAAQLVGGDRDAHGCIPSAGYSWCEIKQKCIRPWEEGC